MVHLIRSANNGGTFPFYTLAKAISAIIATKRLVESTFIYIISWARDAKSAPYREGDIRTTCVNVWNALLDRKRHQAYVRSESTYSQFERTYAQFNQSERPI